MSINLTQSEIKLISCVASDLVSGNHLLGRPRTGEYVEMFTEVALTISNINNGVPLDQRQKSIILELSRNFYDGVEDMVEQLGLDLIKVKNSIND